MVAFCGLVVAAGGARAQETLRIEGLDSPVPLTFEELSTGEQGMVGLPEGASFTLVGYSVSGGPGRALVGQAADILYLAVASGSVTVGDATAEAGEALFLEPLMGGASVVRFDAARLLGTLSADARAAHPGLVADLEGIAAEQAVGIFFGLYEPTRFNLQAGGSGATEESRRLTHGDDVIRRIRFGGVADPARIEELVVAEFLAALRAGDAATVAALLDPTPYGGTDLRGGGAEARALVAARLVASRDWARALGDGGAVRGGSDGLWTVAGREAVTLRNRPVTDFVYVSTIE